MAQITSITSEALQATIRRLLPSQQGFGEDLQASNVILPIIDLTPTAEGSQLQSNLSEAIAFDNQTAFTANNSTVSVVNTPGFWRVIFTSTMVGDGTLARNNIFTMTDGLSNKNVWQHKTPIVAAYPTTTQGDYVFWLKTGDALNATAGIDCFLAGSVRQIADVYGNIANPTGFTFE